MSSKPESTPPPLLPSLQTKSPGSGPMFDYIRYSEFKRLLGSLSSAIDKDRSKVICVLSGQPQEGKTFFTAALALGYAMLLGKRVLMVNTSLHALPGSLSLQRLHQEQLEYVPKFDGQTQATRMIELISPLIDESTSAADFQIGNSINSFKERYDLVLIDTCSLSASNKKNIDPVVIARQSDCSILVTSNHALSRESLATTKTVLAQWQIKVLGTVHNGDAIRAQAVKK